jgi:hypothetical protein
MRVYRYHAARILILVLIDGSSGRTMRPPRSSCRVRQTVGRETVSHRPSRDHPLHRLSGDGGDAVEVVVVVDHGDAVVFSDRRGD